jgi:hypothetical protein
MAPQNFFNFVLFNSLLLYLPLTALVLWRKPGWWLPLQTCFLGIVIGWWDLRITEVSVSAFLLLMLSVFAGYAQPKRAWLFALVLGMWIPVFALVSKTLKITSPTPTELITSLLVFVFTLAGAYGGALVRRFAPRDLILEAHD